MSISLPVKINTVNIGNGPDIQVFYPQISKMSNLLLQRMINQKLVQQTQELIDKQVGNMPSTVKEMLGYYEIKNNQRDVLSISQSNYTYHDRAAHGMTFIYSQTFDLEKGKLCKLKDLFKPGSDYVKRLSELVKEQIVARDIFLLNEFTGIKPDQDFYIADKTIVIYFQLYELTPYVYGFPMFPISVYDLQEIIPETGPLARLAVNN